MAAPRRPGKGGGEEEEKEASVKYNLWLHRQKRPIKCNLRLGTILQIKLPRISNVWIVCISVCVLSV
jgi:hypothetical protein